MLLSERNTLGVASHHLLVHTLSAIYHHRVTLHGVMFFPQRKYIAAADSEGAVLLLDPHKPQKEQLQRLASCVSSYKFAAGTVISDIQPLLTSADQDMVLVAVSQPRVASDDGKRLAYAERRVLVLSVSQPSDGQRASVQLQPAASHNPIDWSGPGGCRLLVRSFGKQKDRVVVAADTLICVYQYEPSSPTPSVVCAIDLAAVSGNDIIWSMSVFQHMVSLSHLFGALAVLNFSSTATFTLHCKGSNRDEGLFAMLSRDLGVASDAREGLLLYGRGGNQLKPLWTLPLDGVAQAHYLNEDSGVLFVGTNLGSLVALRRVEDWKVIEALTIELQGGCEASLTHSLLTLHVRLAHGEGCTSHRA